ncbi:MAG: M56 family metallopeptidase [Lachnospiraceae bacterium]|nr:M56 family metallopeptidase [Lachnospiraceae bacterium]
MTNIFLSFFEISLSISLIVVALILLTSLLNKRYAAKWKYLIWIFIALRLLIPFSGSNGQSVIDILSSVKNQTAFKAEEKNVGTTTDVNIAPTRVIVEIPEQMTTPIAMQSEKSNISLTLLDIVAFLWLIGSLLFISIHLISYLHYKNQVMKRGTIIKDAKILRQMSELKREFNIRCTVHIVEYSEAGSPMILGFAKPILVLPEEQYSPEELFFILKHELVHLKRGDVYFKLLFVAANALHWFNPFIWIMHKEAVVDMELSCDERVTQGTDYELRKAYTETLLSTLHKNCSKRTALSTQFYGGKQIMKKRFKNILLKNGKKNGIAVLICAIVLTIGVGTLVGCTANKQEEKTFDVPDVVVEKAEELISGWYLNEQANNEEYSYINWRIESLTHCYTYDDFEGMVLQIYQLNHEFLSDKPENILLAGGMSVTDDGWVTPGYPNSRFLVFKQDGEALSFLVCLSENDCFPGDELFSEDLKNLLEDMVFFAADDNDAAENGTVLTFTREGETEQKQASLVTGDGFSFYLPDDEWRQTGPDLWSPIVNDSVSLWVTHFEDSAIGQIVKELTDDGYVAVENRMWKQSVDLIYNVELKEYENDVWGVCYCYPVEAEEGWGAVFPVIADTFAVSVDDEQINIQNSDIEDTFTLIESADVQEIKSIVEEFARSYFGGDADTLKKFLTSQYEGNIETYDTYESTGTAGDFTIKGLPEAGERAVNNKLEISLEFMDSNDDSYTYLSLSFVKQEDGWKVKSYGLEK